MKTDEERHSAERFPSNPSPSRDQGILQRRQKDFKSQRDEGHQNSPVNQLSKIHMDSQGLKQQTQGLPGSASDPLCVYYNY